MKKVLKNKKVKSSLNPYKYWLRELLLSKKCLSWEYIMYILKRKLIKKFLSKKRVNFLHNVNLI